MAVMASVATNLFAGGSIGGLLLLALYLLPTIIAVGRKVVNVGSVAAINVFLGWTLIGWVVALAMALRTNPPHAYHKPENSASHSATGPTEPPPPSDHPGWYSDPWGVGVRW